MIVFRGFDLNVAAFETLAFDSRSVSPKNRKFFCPLRCGLALFRMFEGREFERVLENSSSVVVVSTYLFIQNLRYSFVVH